MNAAHAIALLQVPPFDPTLVLGGAEAIAADLARGLGELGAVTVVHGVPAGARVDAEPRNAGPGVRALAGFPIDDAVWRRGCVTPAFTPRARRALDDADLVVTVERVLDAGGLGPRLVCLGGLGYPHSVEVLRSGRWDRLVVPSRHVARRAAELAPASADIVVIENGVDLDVFVSARPALAADAAAPRLLLPARPDWAKGFARAIDLVRALRAGGVSATLRCFEQPDGPAVGTFYRELRARARGIALELCPWRPREGMAAEYAAADLTLCLGDVPEGFGLTAVESVACGTPVLARAAGFLTELLPPGHGLYVLPPDAGLAALVAAARRAIAEGPQRCSARGRPYITKRYDARRMRQAYVGLARALLAR